MALRDEACALPSPPQRLRVYRLETVEEPLTEEPSEEADDFEDAAEEAPTTTMRSSPPNLKASFEDCEVAINKFFNNDLYGAMNLMRYWENTSLYHSLGAAIFQFIPAVLTFDRHHISRTLVSLKVALILCNKKRRLYSLAESIGSILRRPNYATYTDIEAHAELCYAEALLLQGAMTIMDGDDLTGLLKGTLKVKTCFNSYKECVKIMEDKIWEDETSKLQFESGVRLGNAAFSLMISLLPPKVITVLEFVGFCGNKAAGIAELEAGSRAPGMRSVLCDLTLLGYHLVICQFIGVAIDLRACAQILDKQLRVFPHSIWFLMFQGRLEMMHGRIENAMQIYQRAVDSQNQWQQFRHICYWEMMWVHSLQLNFRDASVYAGILLDQSTWSKTVYSYAKAAFLLELDASDRTAIEKLTCNELLRKAADYKQRIAGKSFPMEKFVIKRCARYAAQGGHLILPGIELMCLFNMFHILAKQPRNAHGVIRIIEMTREIVDGHSISWMGPYKADNRALVRFLHGSCLAAINLPRLAIDTLDTVLKLKNEIKEDTFLIPYSLAEMAACHFTLGERDYALQLLMDARKKCSGYSLESRLQFRLHTKIDMVKNAIAAADAVMRATL